MRGVKSEIVLRTAKGRGKRLVAHDRFDGSA
jgi:hypothetical protein